MQQKIITNDLIDRFKRKGAPLKTSEIEEAGYSYKEIMRLEESGEIRRFKNGYYICPEVEPDEEAIVRGLFPDGVLTMEIALFYHGYLREKPMHWSIAVSKNISKSKFKMDYPIVKPFYTEESTLKMGIEDMSLKDGKMLIYNKNRLICEILKYEEKISRDDFKEAVFSYINDGEKNISEFIEFAKKRRILNKARSVIGLWL